MLDLKSDGKIMRKLLPYFFFVISAVTSKAVTYTPTPADLNDLDHHLAYSWRIDNINLGGATITGASLTFSNIANWDTNPNMLFVHLLDTAKDSGVRSFTDASGVPVPSNQINDNFAGWRYLVNPLVNGATTANTWLASQSFTMTPTTFTINFTQAQLAILQSYIASGNNIAFGIDPDCHFFNSGITFSFSVPEPASSAALLTLGLVSVGVARRKFSL
jgi:hypothetical protein